MRKATTGFTLIELMIVIGIVGILAAIAIPAYNFYLIRARVSELINASAVAKTGVTEYRLSKGTMPTSNTLSGVTSITTNYVTSISVSANGVITVVGNQTTLGTGGAISVILTPTYNNGAVSWVCSASGTTQYVPSTCN